MKYQQRDHILFEFTKSICPDCRELVDAHVLIRDNKVYMKKRCGQHGQFESLISSDAQRYVKSYEFNKPGLIPPEFGKKSEKGCPYDCGLCPDHEQHSCVGIIEITNACNLRCPTCFASAQGHDFLSSNEVEFMLDQFVKQEGSPEIVQFSGGEPTIHPQILDMIRLARAKNIPRVMVNTNGIRISKDEEFVKELGKLNPVIYLQFDGLTDDTYLKLRGARLKDAKMKAIENLEKYGLMTVLVATIQRGVNESEIGNLIDFALTNGIVRGLVLQPTFYSGRHPDVDPMNIVTYPEVIKLACTQSKFGLIESDFVPNPCCFPTCNQSCYMYVDDKDTVPLARVVNVEDYIDYFTNRPVADLGQIKQSLNVLNSCCGDGQSSVCCTIPDLRGIEKNIKVIMVQSFMDAFSFDVKKVMKCCIHEITPDGKIIPFCAFNNIPQYREDVNRYYQKRSVL
ncbi:MAG: radical SAM protein [Thaumarchaeota archaeon]|nr:radical SAM protein [Nitrososphaerota archaeon]MDE1832140.1 radical SAM protein [Nitrososphaerota archaeon]MDE1841602.1 radical SAM protein [Nitrososphaerota archaeon]